MSAVKYGRKTGPLGAPLHFLTLTAAFSISEIHNDVQVPRVFIPEKLIFNVLLFRGRVCPLLVYRCFSMRLISSGVRVDAGIIGFRHTRSTPSAQEVGRCICESTVVDGRAAVNVAVPLAEPYRG